MLRAHWQMPDGYYLYRHRFEFAVPAGSPFVLGEAEIPQGKVKNDEYFGEVQVYYHEVSARVPVTRTGIGTPACSRRRSRIRVAPTAGLCYPPQTKHVSFPAESIAPAKARSRASQRHRADGAPAEKTEEQHLATSADARKSVLCAGHILHGRNRPCVYAVRAADGADSVEHHRRTRRFGHAPSRLYALVGICARHGLYVRDARRARRVVRREHESAGGVAVAAGSDRFRDRVRAARVVDVRPVRTAAAAGVAEPRECDVAEPARRRIRRRRRHGQFVEPGGVAVFVGAAGRRVDRDQFDGRRDCSAAARCSRSVSAWACRCC